MAGKVDSLLGQMTLDQKIGQILMFGWQGENDEENITVSWHARLLLEEFHVGAVVLLGRNVGTPDRTARTMNELQDRSDIPLFIIADQEGGMVARFKSPFVVFPSNMALGATGDPELAYRAARATAEQLLAVGVNFDFAPCVDVNNNPLNPIIGTRSYGDNPDVVARFTRRAIDGFRDGGVATSAKHFPGHGDTAVDSHLALPSVDFDRQRMNSVELPPFKAAMDAGVDSIMTTHILFTAVDPELPATLSERIIKGLLREEMGYAGLVITDDLEMKGVAAKWGTANSALMCLKAGVDCPLICHTLEEQRAAVALIKQAIRDGDITEERIEQSARRMLELKERRGILDGARRADPESTEAIVSGEDKQSLALEIGRCSVTVVKDEDGILPLKLADSDEIAVLSMHPSLQDFTAAFNAAGVRATAIPIEGAEASQPDLLKLSERFKALVVATCPSEPWTAGIDEEAQASLVKHLMEANVPLVVVALRDPYDLRRFPDVPTYVTLYGYRQASLQAAAEIIAGKQKATGALPVALS